MFRLKNNLQSKTVYLCVSKTVVYVAFCLIFLRQVVRSFVNWKPTLRNFKSRIKKKVPCCSIVNHFIDVCSDTDDPSKILDLLSVIY